MFSNPGILAWLALAVAAAGALGAWGTARRRRLSGHFGDAAVLSRLVAPEAAGRRRLRFILQASGLALCLLALAGPQWGVELVETRGRAPVAVVAIDVSMSMLAEDVRPNRLEKAKGEFSLLLAELGRAGARVGVVAFAGEPQLVCPLTTDVEAARQLLAAVGPGSVPTPGTGIGKAVRLAGRALARYPGARNIVLLTDGEDHKTDPLGASEEAANEGVRIFSIGIGTPEGEPIPLKTETGSASEGYKKDPQGRTVVSRLGEKDLIAMASRTGGAYYRATPGEAEASEIARSISESSPGAATAGTAQRYRNRYLYPLWAGFMLLLLEMVITERKGKISGTEPTKTPMTAGAALGAILMLAAPANSATAEGELRAGNRLYKNEKYLEAIERYGRSAKRSPLDYRPIFNAGDALYRVDELDQAAETFEALARPENPADLRADALYNLGNVHVRKGDIPQAVASYRRSLAARPRDPDTLHNLAAALKMLQNPPPKNQKPPPPKPKDQDKKEEPKQPKPEPGAPKDEPQGKPPEKPPAARPQDQISQEDAERILRAGAEKEKAAQQKIQQRPVGNPKPPAGEDW